MTMMKTKTRIPAKQTLIELYINNREQGLECEQAFTLALNDVKSEVIEFVSLYVWADTNEDIRSITNEFKELQNELRSSNSVHQLCELNWQAVRNGGSVHEFQL
jgi:hypothetical protein